MRLHANARTCPKSRRLLVGRVEEERPHGCEVAGSLACGRRRGIVGSQSAPRRRPTRMAADRVQAIEALRRLRMTAAEIAECLGMALSTVSRWLQRLGLGRLWRLQPPEPA